MRSDAQLVALFRAGHEDAFRVIHDRYRTRLLAYTCQMFPGSRQDAEDALQDVFVKAYSGLRAGDRDLALRAWLYRIAHNRCIDVLRRPHPIIGAELDTPSRELRSDPIAATEQREVLRRLIADVQRLPEQQRSALLMRELSGMSYEEMADALDVTVPAIKSLLVRARVNLAAAMTARDTACEVIRAAIVDCHDRGVRPTATARRHLHDCAGCREFREGVRSTSRQIQALTPLMLAGGVATGSAGIGHVPLLAKILGMSGSAAGSGSVASASGGGVAAAGGSAGALSIGSGHLASLLAAAVVTAGGAVAIQPVLSAHRTPRHARAHAIVRTVTGSAPATASASGPAPVSTAPVVPAGAREETGAATATGDTSARTKGTAGLVMANTVRLPHGASGASASMTLGGDSTTTAGTTDGAAAANAAQAALGGQAAGGGSSAASGPTAGPTAASVPAAGTQPTSAGTSSTTAGTSTAGTSSATAPAGGSTVTSTGPSGGVGASADPGSGGSSAAPVTTPPATHAPGAIRIGAAAQSVAHASA